MLPNYVIVAQQKKDALYVCELCQKHGKSYRSIPLIENDESQVATPIEIKIVPSDDNTLSSQIHSRHGKVCNLSYPHIWY